MILGFYGNSNSGKTTLIEKICRDLKKENLKITSLRSDISKSDDLKITSLRSDISKSDDLKITSLRSDISKSDDLKIAVIKHIPHKNFSLYNKTKDTGKFKNLGVDVVAFSPDETAFILGEMNFSDMISKLKSIDKYDVILVEGLKKQNIPKVRVGDCPIESNTIIDYKIAGDLKIILKWIKNEIQKEEREREEKKKLLVQIIQVEKIRTTKLKGMDVRTTKARKMK